jgi:predicted RNase H-like HicB family nuclease
MTKKNKISVTVTSVIKKGKDGNYIGYIEEMPGVFTEGKSLDATKTKLKDALKRWIEIQREDSEKELKGTKFIREELTIKI